MASRSSVLVFLFALASAPACGDDGSGENAAGTESGTDSTTGRPGTTTDVEDPTTSGSPSGTATETGMSDTITPGTGSTSSATGSTGEGPSTGTGGSSTGSAACEGMSFFATSVGSGVLGGNLGGLEGADAICQGLADAVGQGSCTWHAYLSSSQEDARDRIGPGPWYNFAGDMIAADVESLHTDGLSNGDPQHVLDENGNEVPGNEHDILTGSQEDGTLMDGATCNDWTSDSSDDIGRVGHSDIPGNPQFSPSWNSAHDSAGCSENDLDSTGGAGRLYCFAI